MVCRVYIVDENGANIRGRSTDKTVNAVNAMVSCERYGQPRTLWSAANAIVSRERYGLQRTLWSAVDAMVFIE